MSNLIDCNYLIVNLLKSYLIARFNRRKEQLLGKYYKGKDSEPFIISYIKLLISNRQIFTQAATNFLSWNAFQMPSSCVGHSKAVFEFHISMVYWINLLLLLSSTTDIIKLLLNEISGHLGLQLLRLKRMYNIF